MEPWMYFLAGKEHKEIYCSIIYYSIIWLNFVLSLYFEFVLQLSELRNGFGSLKLPFLLPAWFF